MRVSRGALSLRALHHEPPVPPLNEPPPLTEPLSDAADLQEEDPAADVGCVEQEIPDGELAAVVSPEDPEGVE